MNSTPNPNNKNLNFEKFFTREELARKFAEREKNLKKRSMLNGLFALLISMITGILVSYVSGGGEFYKAEEENNRVSSDFKTSVVQLLKNGEIINHEILILLYEGAEQRKIEKSEIINRARRALVELHFALVHIKGIGEISDSDPSWNENIRNLIEGFDDVSPYSTLQPTEQTIFEDITKMNTNKDIDNKLHQLADIFKVRFDELEEAKSEARWSLIVGIAGLVGAMVSIGLAIMQGFQRNLKFDEIEFEAIKSNLTQK